MKVNFVNIVLIVFIIIFSCERRYSGGVKKQDNLPRISKPENTINDKLSNVSDNQEIIDSKVDQSKVNPNSPPKVSELFKKLEKSVFMVFATDNYGSGSQGSGFLINNNIGITNYHVIDRNANNYFILINDKFYPIDSFYDYSITSDLDYIIFKIEGFNGIPLKISSSRPEIGDDVFAIGSPKGLQNSLTKGTISGFRENSRIQIDATIDHGSSGGPLFNMRGEVIGVTSGGIEGSALNFAIDIQKIPYNKF